MSPVTAATVVKPCGSLFENSEMGIYSWRFFCNNKKKENKNQNQNQKAWLRKTIETNKKNTVFKTF